DRDRRVRATQPAGVRAAAAVAVRGGGVLLLVPPGLVRHHHHLVPAAPGGDGQLPAPGAGPPGGLGAAASCPRAGERRRRCRRASGAGCGRPNGRRATRGPGPAAAAVASPPPATPGDWSRAVP